MKISDDASFNDLMEKIDTRLKQEGVLIHARPVRAWILTAQAVNASLPFSGEAIPGDFEGASLVGHLHDWFQNRYGERLKLDFSPGRFPVDIRGDLYLVRLPLILGQACVGILRQRVDQPRPSHGPVLANVFDWVENLSDNFRQIASQDELSTIFVTCALGLEQVKAWQGGGKAFVREIGFDVCTSADLAVNGVHGMSRWHSLQIAEKALKHFIKTKGSEFSRVHDLSRLHREAMGAGLPPLAAENIRIAQCGAEVRYSHEGSDQVSALAANVAAREIATAIGLALKP